MPRLNRNDNFIDKTFTIVADLILKVFPTSRLVKFEPATHRLTADCSTTKLQKNI